MIKIKKLTYKYPNGFKAINNISLEIKSGENVAIIGQNGAGKTTLAKLLNGLFQPSEGNVIIDGIDTVGKSTAQISKYVGYVFQNPDEQIFNSTTRSELEYTLKYLNYDEDEINKRIDEAVKITGIEEFLDMNPMDIPLSIRKFVTIGMVLTLDTPCVILDEPTAGQDLYGVNKLQELLSFLKAKGKTAITITHDMEFVVDNFSRVVVMANGKIIADGTPSEIFQQPNIIKEAKIKEPQITQVANESSLGKGIINRSEVVRKLNY